MFCTLDPNITRIQEAKILRIQSTATGGRVYIFLKNNFLSILSRLAVVEQKFKFYLDLLQQNEIHALSEEKF